MGGQDFHRIPEPSTRRSNPACRSGASRAISLGAGAVSGLLRCGSHHLPGALSGGQGPPTQLPTTDADAVHGRTPSGIQQQTVAFGPDGQTYEIDLDAEHAGELCSTFQRYIAASAGSASSPPRRPSPVAPDPDDPPRRRSATTPPRSAPGRDTRATRCPTEAGSPPQSSRSTKQPSTGDPPG